MMMQYLGGGIGHKATHDSAPPTPAQDLVVEVDDNGVDDSDEHMDGVEATGRG